MALIYCHFMRPKLRTKFHFAQEKHRGEAAFAHLLGPYLSKNFTVGKGTEGISFWLSFSIQTSMVLFFRVEMLCMMLITFT